MCDHKHEKHVAHEVAVVCRDIAALIERSEYKAYASNELSVAQRV